MKDQVLLRFLESVGQKADIDLYLGLFRAQKKESFAILVVEARVVASALDPLHFDLRLLAGAGLIPVVLLGLVEPVGAMEQAGRIKDWLLEDGVGTRVFPTRPAAAAPSELWPALVDCIHAGDIPVVVLTEGEALDRRFALLGELAAALETRKVVFLGSRGALARPGVTAPSVVNLALDYDALLGSTSLSRKQAALLREIKRLLETVRHRMSAAVTNPLHLLRELFTVKGAGTLIKLGSRIDRFEGLDGVDVPRLERLVESAFGHRLQPAFLDRPLERVYLEESYQGAALFTRAPMGPYLSKFAVERRAQGEGIGTDLWAALCADHASFFWRSRPANPIAPWYVKQCDGMQRVDRWQVFWKGIGPDRIEETIRWALEAPVDFR
ncbi:MAG: hypothetical protein HYY06_26380 [Deltaproteobacteria bacterium]|nr:hypothetical protein [Deltaproteobacteria bacterium]